ncbi:hypothetical protein PG993_010169 [Apiospora rasikravindrae]|uniref:Uncharacterized protein n=1 Tax=Apiospora rasikravindrae TaxID=990691 RepID=A0ABR1SLH1_9PEZI
MKFGYPGTPPSQIKRPQLKRQAEAFAGGDPFFEEHGERSPKKRRILSFPIGPPKDKHTLLCRGSAAAARRYRKITDSSPTAAKAKTKRKTKVERKTKRLITADESTTVGRLDLFAWQTDYIQTSSTLATPKSKNRPPPKKSRQAAASRLVLGKGIADVGFWLGNSTSSPAHALAQQFSGDGLLDGILGTSTMLTKSVALRHQQPLRQRSLGTPPKTPVSIGIPQTPIKVTMYDEVARNDTIQGEIIYLAVGRGASINTDYSDAYGMRHHRTYNACSTTSSIKTGPRRHGGTLYITVYTYESPEKANQENIVSASCSDSRYPKYEAHDGSQRSLFESHGATVLSLRKAVSRTYMERKR